MATCRECGVTARFMVGYDPTLRWEGGICPACRRAHLMRMGEEEKRRAIMVEIHRDPAAPATVLAQRTGLGKALARKVRKEAVQQGIAERLNWNGTPASNPKPKPKRKTKRTAKVEAGTAEVKAAVVANPGVGSGEVAEAVKMTHTTARRHLKALVDAGEIRSTKKGRNVCYWPVESGSKSG